jgi:pyruvate dehydrogenase E2 component (dihydrolipoamide acetyltransferase)
MATNVIMPALELAQETGKVLRWIKSPGQSVSKGEPLLEIETDKVTVEVEAPASGILRDVTAGVGDVVPVGKTIAVIVAAGEVSTPAAGESPAPAGMPSPVSGTEPVKASPLARRLAEQHGVDLTRITTASGKIEKADVMAYVEAQKAPAGNGAAATPAAAAARLVAASPKARRLAAERGVELRALRGTGPGGAVIADDVVAARTASMPPRAAAAPAMAAGAAAAGAAATAGAQGVSNVWRIMAERMTSSWTTVPHFFLVREVNVGRLASWLMQARKQGGAQISYTDLLVRVVAAAISQQPRVNVSWKDGTLVQHSEINVGLAVALDDGLVVPVIHRAETFSLAQLAEIRRDLVTRARSGKLRPGDIQGGTFTISNLGPFGVDAFSAIVNPPQAAILAVGRIADRVVPVNGQPVVQPTMVLTLSCDHRALDGARGAQFLGALADLIEEPLALLR